MYIYIQTDLDTSVSFAYPGLLPNGNMMGIQYNVYVIDVCVYIYLYVFCICASRMINVDIVGIEWGKLGNSPNIKALLPSGNLT
jgi:hypothetical protein